ncbi:hypothetical protein F4777DRAFT_565055 [Nemania sp. FL0916]|nr:hypothetical protein F4777DRAFT_565055 [Nemania sp. FL0916]
MLLWRCGSIALLIGSSLAPIRSENKSSHSAETAFNGTEEINIFKRSCRTLHSPYPVLSYPCCAVSCHNLNQDRAAHRQT